jgi:hypothetical protein
MQLDALLQTEHQLDQLAGQFEHWRQRRSHLHDRIPEPLWEQAVALTATLSPSRVAKHLRLRLSDLKAQITKRQGATAVQRPPHSAAPSFVEVPPPPVPSPGLGSLEVEVYRPDGARLRLHSPDASLPLATIIHSFLEAQ